MLTRWDAQREEVILIKLHKKLLASTAVGAALILSVVLIVSMAGNDKPSTTTNPPPADEEQPPASAPESPSAETEVPTAPEEEPEPEEDENEQPEEGGDEPAPEKGKATGLARAYEVHVRNLERMQEMLAAEGMATMSADCYPHGLVHSTMKLAEKLGIEANLWFTPLEKADAKGHGNGKGNAFGLGKA